MLKILLISVIIFTNSLFSIEIVEDEVSMGVGATNQVFYSLPDGEIANINNMDWHLAFQNAKFDAGVLANGAAGVKVYHVESLLPNDWNEVIDINDKDNWAEHYNSTEYWAVGALNIGKYGFVEDDEDYGWGTYDFGSHDVIGNQIFVIELPGSVYYKFMIERRQISGKWYFKYAEPDDTDGSTEVKVTIDIADYEMKNFAYFNFDDGEINREPDTDKWDFTFTKYIKLIQAGPQVMPYPVTGIKSNYQVAALYVESNDIENAEMPDGPTLSESLTAIGDDWKDLASMDPVVYEILDRVYFIRSKSGGDIYKLQFTDYEGASTGVIKFKKAIVTTSVNETNDFEFTVYPNVVDGSNSQINIISYDKFSGNANIKLIDVTGNVIVNKNISTNGFEKHQLQIDNLASGMYFLIVNDGDFTGTKKIIVK